MKRIIVGIVLILTAYAGWHAMHYIGIMTPANNLSPSEVPTNQPSIEQVTPIPFTAKVVAQDLYVPWSIVFTAKDRLLVSERSGSIRAVTSGNLRREPLYTFSEVATPQEAGLLGLALGPDYASTKAIYACLTYQKAGSLYDKVVRLLDQQDTLTLDTVIIDDIPAAQYHAGCEIAFGPDGKLYITTGDATQKNLAQDLNSLAGKILRLNPDGSVPSDNPFSGSFVYSYGHRNPQGIAWHPDTNKLYSSEHGPSIIDGPAGGDEINRIVAGGNYGWPLVSHDDNQPGLITPEVVFTPAEAPASSMIYSGKTFPQFTNNLFVAALKGEGILRFNIAADNNSPRITLLEKIDLGFGRIRDITEAPDGTIYVTTSNQDGRGDVQTGDDKIIQLMPE